MRVNTIWVTPAQRVEDQKMLKRLAKMLLRTDKELTASMKELAKQTMALAELHSDNCKTQTKMLETIITTRQRVKLLESKLNASAH